MLTIAWLFVLLAAVTNLFQYIYPDLAWPLTLPLVLFCLIAHTLFRASEREDA